MDATGRTRSLLPPAKKRHIQDVLMENDEAPLERPDPCVYDKVVRQVLSDFKTGVTPVLQAPMGWGKTTYFLLYLADAAKDIIYLTVPNRELAYDIHRALTSAAKRAKPNIKIGKKIEGAIV